MRHLLLASVLFVTSSLAFAQPDKPVDATITIDNVGANAYVLTDAEGAGVAEVGVENAAWTLQVGHRYHVVNNGELLFHPLEMRSDTDALLVQGDPEGMLEGDTEIDFVSDDEGVTFTLTPELAALLTTYRCTYHSAMTGPIVVDTTL